MSDDASKYISLDSIYFLSCIFLLLIIVSEKNIIDVIYYFVLTICYVRLKVYKFRNHNL